MKAPEYYVIRTYIVCLVLVSKISDPPSLLSKVIWSISAGVNLSGVEIIIHIHVVPQLNWIHGLVPPLQRTFSWRDVLLSTQKMHPFVLLFILILICRKYLP